MNKVALVLSISLLIGIIPDSRAVEQTILAAKGTQFTVNGAPTFLYGISYYGGLGASPATWTHDLDTMRSNRFNWIRVWANWSSYGKDVSAVDEDGRPRDPFLQKLATLVKECDARGMIVDVTLTRGAGLDGKLRLATLEAHQRAVETVIKTLPERRNWYLDLSNERNIRDKRYTSIDDLKALRMAARRLAPDLLVTASHSPDLSKEELRNYLEVVRVDFIAPHRPRDPDSAAQTEAQTKTYFALFAELGHTVPVIYQEPFRRGYTKGWNPTAEDFLRDARGAISGGAAGWCFHNGSQHGPADERPRRSFDLTDLTLFEQLDPEEMKAIAILAHDLSQRP